MTFDEAIELAADWWLSMFRSGRWDNGDAETEITHAMFRGMGYQPKEEDWPIAREALVAALRSEQRKTWNEAIQCDLYSDYGCREIDKEFRARGLKLTGVLHGPQKSGTQIRETDPGSGEFTLKAKSGYGGPWEEIAAKVAAESEGRDG